MKEFMYALTPEMKTELRAAQKEAHNCLMIQEEQREMFKLIVSNMVNELGIDEENKDDLKAAKKEIGGYFKATYKDNVKELLDYAEAVSFLADATEVK